MPDTTKEFDDVMDKATEMLIKLNYEDIFNVVNSLLLSAYFNFYKSTTLNKSAVLKEYNSSMNSIREALVKTIDLEDRDSLNTGTEFKQDDADVALYKKYKVQ